MKTKATASLLSLSGTATVARGERKRLLLINPRNPLVKLSNKTNYWNRYRVWKPLGLLVLAGVTPADWEVTVVDENVQTPDYAQLPRPHLVGVTAFTSQAPRAYEIAALFHDRGVPVVMGGIHATMCRREASERVDCIVTGEAEGVWPRVLADAAAGTLRAAYDGGLVDMEQTPSARHDLLPDGYKFGSIQTTRGCPLNCSFCSVSAFNGRAYRRRETADVVAEFQLIRENLVLVVDDNLIGTRREHVERAKVLFRAMIAADLGKKWICQATINMADDDELLGLARRAGCIGVFIGFESATDEGLVEVHKQYHIQKTRDFKASVGRIQKHGICVAGSFIIGLDVDRPGIGRKIADTANGYGLDVLNVLYLTPLPGTELWTKMEGEGSITSDSFPEDWQYYTLTIPVGRYLHLNREQVTAEMNSCIRRFYTPVSILRRTISHLVRRRQPALTMVANLSFRKNGRLSRKMGQEIRSTRDRLLPIPFPVAAEENRHVLGRSLQARE